MTKQDVRAERFNVAGTNKIGFFVPEKISDTWQWYEDQKAFGKFCINQEEGSAIQKEILDYIAG